MLRSGGRGNSHGTCVAGTVAAAVNGVGIAGVAPNVDETSRDFAPGVEYPRDITPDCIDLPREGENVVSVTALGPSTVKADQLRTHARGRLRPRRLLPRLPRDSESSDAGELDLLGLPGERRS